MEQKRLVIIGAGCVGGYLAYNLNIQDAYTLLGFLDDDPEKQGTWIYEQPVLGPVSQIDELLEAGPLSVVIGIAAPKARKAIAELLLGRDIHWPNFIATQSWISSRVTIGKGVIVYPGVSVNYGTQLGDFALINMNCALGHNCFLAAYSTLAPGVNLAGYTRVEACADIGIGTCSRQNTIIGPGAQVGGQSMITRNVPADCKVKGVPARIYQSTLPVLRPRAIGQHVLMNQER